MASALIGLGSRDSAEKVLLALYRDEPYRISTNGRLAVLAARRGDREATGRWLSNAPQHQHGEALLYEARVAAVLGDKEIALQKLGEALAAGVDNWHWMVHYADPDFSALRNDARFLALMSIRDVMPEKREARGERR